MARRTQAGKITEKILQLNQKSADTGIGPRDSDKELLIQFMQRYLGVNLTSHQRDLIRQMNAGSITRARRKFQEQGKYLPDSPEVARKRRLKYLIATGSVMQIDR